MRAELLQTIIRDDYILSYFKIRNLNGNIITFAVINKLNLKFLKLNININDI